MAQDALEVHMLYVGDADCILVTRWRDEVPTRVLIDGGDRHTADGVKKKLKGLGATKLDYVVCSHLDDDHAAGLVEIVRDGTFEIGQAFMHVVGWHVDPEKAKADVAGSGIIKEAARIITASVETNGRLFQAFQDRGRTPTEPFSGEQIGDLLVCGPSQEYYETLVQELVKATQADPLDLLIERAMEKEASAKGQPLLANPKDTFANNSSTILTTSFGDRRLLFTADAGIEAQRKAIEYADSRSISLADLSWIQVPHHGSRRAINKVLIDTYRAKLAYVSAEGDGHPVASVVDAFKAHGRVYGTHHPERGALRFHIGDAPDRGMVEAVPL